MGIENPLTFGDYYWNRSLDSIKVRAEEIEKSLSPIAKAIVGDIPDMDKLPKGISSLLTSISNPTQPDWDNVLIRFVSNMAAGLGQRILGHEVKEFDYHMNEYLHNTLITPDIANTLRLRGKITDDLWKARQLAGGFSDIEGAFVYESQKPYPALPDIITYARYNVDPFNPKEDVLKRFDISPNDWALWDFLSWQKLNTEQTLTLYKRHLFDNSKTDRELAALGWQSDDRRQLLQLAYSLPNPMLILQGGLLGELDADTIIKKVIEADIHPDYAKLYVDAVLTKPSTQDIIEYMLRKDPTLSNLPKELRKIGIHGNYNDLYKELAYPIPPIQDIITMAVREAFSPDVASKFGQYQDLPPAYVEWAGKKGLTKDWAERYWASHWSLPSPQQGFEMLHRGIINRAELDLLLRALDIMPFWRDKLVKMAYRPLTRVDVRRMYSLGVLDRTGVDKAYKELGYDDEKSKLMTEFTISQVRQSLSKFTTNDVITAYKKRFIDSGQARNLLRDLGIKDADINNIISGADNKRSWAIKEERIQAIENLFKKSRYNESQTRRELSSLGLPSDHIDTLIQQWQLKLEIETPALWTTAQTLSFLKSGLITQDRGKQELQLLGYNEERIKIYLASAVPQTE